MPVYTVKDSQTGKTIKFQWDGSEPPTDSDMEQIFAQAKTYKNPNRSVGERITNAAKNLPGNMADVAGTMAQTVLHPIKTAAGLRDLAEGGAAYAIRGISPKSREGIPETPQESSFRQNVAEPVSEMVKDPSKLADYAEARPAEFLMNASLGLGVAGKAAEISKLAQTGKVLSKASELTNPISVAGKAIAPAEKALRKAASSKAPEFYESALKIPPSVPNEIRAKAIQTGIEGKYLPTQMGLNKLKGDITGLNTQITSMIDDAARSGKTVDLNDVVTRIDNVKDFYKDHPRAQKYLKELEDIKLDILTDPTHGNILPIDQAQRMKQRIYAVNKKHYGELKSLEVEADKAVARGLKEEIVSAHPELSALNAKDSALINLGEVLERAVNRTRNYDVIRLGDTIITATGATLGGPGGSVGAFLTKRVLEDASVKARIAFALDKAGKKAPLASRISKKSLITNAMYQAGKSGMEQ